MKFSIIVPVYNVFNFLPACMASLLEQQGETDYEIILVDDGSTDGSGILCNGYAKAFPDRVQVIHQKNGGLGAARNTGLKAARGQYIWFVDSDDYLRLDALSVLRRALEQTGAEMVVFGFTYVWENRQLPGEMPMLAGQPATTLHEHPELLLQAPNSWMRICKRSVFEQPEIRFPDRVWFEDLRTTAKQLVQCESVAVIDEKLYFYRQREGSILHSPNLRRNLEILDALEDLYGYFEGQGLLEAYRPWLEALAVESVILSAQRVLMKDPKAAFLPEFTAYLEKRFPGCENGEKVRLLGSRKRMVLRMLQRGQYGLLRGIFLLRQRMRR